MSHILYRQVRKSAPKAKTIKSYKKCYVAIRKYDEHSDQSTRANDHHTSSREKKSVNTKGSLDHYDLLLYVGEDIDI